MKNLKFYYFLLSLATMPFCSWAESVGIVLNSGLQSHINRDFERRILTAGVKLESRDIVEVDEGILVLEMAGAKWSMQAGSRFRLKKDAVTSVMELMTGEGHLLQEKDFAWRIETSQVQIKGSKGEVWFSLDETGLECAFLSGESQYNTILLAPKWLTVSTPCLYRFSLGRIFPLAKKSLEPMEALVYREKLKPNISLSPSGTRNLEGQNFLPTESIFVAEQERREHLSQANKKKGEHLQILKSQFDVMRADQFKETQEIMRVEEAFSYPAPLVPPPK